MDGHGRTWTDTDNKDAYKPLFEGDAPINAGEAPAIHAGIGGYVMKDGMAVN